MIILNMKDLTQIYNISIFVWTSTFILDICTYKYIKKYGINTKTARNLIEFSIIFTLGFMGDMWIVFLWTKT